MLALKVGLVVSNQALWSEVHDCLATQPVRVLLEQTAVGDLDAFAAAVEPLRLDVLLIDLTKLDCPGEQVLKRIKGLHNPPMIIALHERAEPEEILSAMRSGANEFLYPPLEAGLTRALERQANERKKTSQAARQRGRALGFTSVKGGCGATTIACHLAAEIGRSTNQEVLLADLDLDSGMVGFLMQAKGQYTIVDAAKNVHRLDQSYWSALVSRSQAAGIDVIAAPALAGLREPLGPDPYRHVLGFLRASYDWMVVDLGRSLTPVTAGVLDDLDEIYLVGVMDLPALHQAKQVIQCLVDAGFSRNQLKLLLNRMPRRPDFAPNEVQRALGLPIYEMLPDDYPELYQAYSQGTLLPATSELAKALAALAGKITGVQVKEKSKQRSALSLFQF